MVGTRSQELTKVRAASTMCATRAAPDTCLMVASVPTMATRLNNAATVTTARMKGAVSSSSMYREQICSAGTLLIQTKINTSNRSTPKFQLISARLIVDQWIGNTKKAANPATAESQTRGCCRRSLFTQGTQR